MAITQVTAPASVPAAIADYQAQNAHISAFNMIVNNQPFILTNSENTSIPAIAIGSYIQFGGNLYIVDTEDYAITGTPVDGNNYIRLSGSTTLTAEWVQDISSYVWNPVYGYKYTGSYAILPYLVVKASAEYTKYNDIIVYPSFANQDLKTTASPTFAGITTTNGPNKPVNNNDSSLPTIGIGGFTYGVLPPRTENTLESFTLPTGGTYVYVISASEGGRNTSTRIGKGAGGSTTLEIYGESGWQTSIIAWRIA